MNSKVKKTRNRKKIKTAEIRILIEPKYKDAVKSFCENNEITMTTFITEAIIANLENYGYLEKD
jgi:hypothetical protein